MTYASLKRCFDLLASAGLAVLLMPVWLSAALLVKLSSPGPVLFCQARGGLGGRPFDSYKFRTMHCDHRHDPAEIVPLTHAAITPAGRILRRLKIDELPQLINVLRGDMSLVGPRPTIMEQVSAYDHFQRRRLEVRPGITGLAQVNGNANISWDERIRYDVYYVDHMGLWLDLSILGRTLAVIVLGEARFSQPFEQSRYGRSAPRVHVEGTQVSARPSDSTRETNHRR